MDAYDRPILNPNLSARNPHVKGTLGVTFHAQERWYDRGEGGEAEMIAAIESAVPFGFQKGNGKLLLSGEVAFAIKDGMVLTVLSRAHAIANAQMFVPAMRRVYGRQTGLQLATPPINQVTAAITTEPDDVNRTVAVASTFLRTHASISDVTEETLLAIIERCDQYREVLEGVPPKGLRASLGVLKNQALQRVNALRKAKRDETRFAELVQCNDKSRRELTAIKAVVREFLEPDLWESFFARVQAVRAELEYQETKPC